LKADCRKRFSALFGCACAVDGLGVETCAEWLAASLGFDELPREYLSAMKRGLEVCSKRTAAGLRPLFSIRRALAGEGEGKVWYSIKECITALPKLKWAAEEERAAPAQRAPLAEEQAPPAPEAEALALEAETYAPPEVAQQVELVVSGEEDAWRELEQFIQRHRL